MSSGSSCNPVYKIALRRPRKDEQTWGEFVVVRLILSKKHEALIPRNR